MGKKSSAAFSDKRFAHLKEDPKFVGLPQKHRKVELDLFEEKIEKNKENF